MKKKTFVTALALCALVSGVASIVVAEDAQARRHHAKSQRHHAHVHKHARKHAHRHHRRHAVRRIVAEGSSHVGAGAQGGIASIYSLAGRKTANGERANPAGFTAAHKTLPFGTRVQVVNKRNGRTVVVRINDRGPFVRGRVIDLTPAGARVLGFSGLTQVSLSVVR